KTFPVWARWLICIAGVSISCSTVFVKQHSLIDVFAAIALAVVCFFLFFRGKIAEKIDALP
ncbi:MAG: hypothetical protein J6P36_03140, partial [Lachnospiraceae bacterium]|nr:hypothetical protein [Lachnospiraceae bacterium]